MRVAIVTGTGTYALPDLEAGEPREVATPFGPALINPGRVGGVEVLHVSRHGEGHARLSNHVNHRANVAALVEMGADCVLAVTVCGAVERSVPLGSLIVFDDLHFLANRLPDGSLCTLYGEAGDRLRGHWIFESPFAAELRRALLAGAAATGHAVRDGGCYAHVDGPRFNTRTEIRMLAQCGVTAVSQTAAAEAVLCGEAELPFALLGYATDYANGVAEEATPVAELMRLIGESGEVFSAVLSETLPLLAPDALAPSGTVYRFED
ncbi:MAG: MTAP family purine nucleoside phosphorylase [Thermoleophilaceae bacterium]|jgi:purine nucleoside phosphorylase|nr:MTAP family purine nucleoside phosphorylase [Thermoleophilaceae bacterium]MBA3839641.1 MTAP family purine nucleoside phosphorylase [Thermoleophilaceae bacterium]